MGDICESVEYQALISAGLHEDDARSVAEAAIAARLARDGERIRSQAVLAFFTGAPGAWSAVIHQDGTYELRPERAKPKPRSPRKRISSADIRAQVGRKLVHDGPGGLYELVVGLVDGDVALTIVSPGGAKSSWPFEGMKLSDFPKSAGLPRKPLLELFKPAP